MRSRAGKMIGAGLAAGLLAASTAVASFTPLGDTPLYETSQSASTCDRDLMEEPFARVGDDRSYVEAPGGSFEHELEGWQLAGGARVVEHDGGSRAHAEGDEKALRLPPGASVISPVMCVDLDYPHFRFLTRGSWLSKLRVEVVYPNAPEPGFDTRARFDAGDGVSANGNGWRLSEDVALRPEEHGTEFGARRVAIRISTGGLQFGGFGLGNWLIDEINVDPRKRI